MRGGGEKKRIQMEEERRRRCILSLSFRIFISCVSLFVLLLGEKVSDQLFVAKIRRNDGGVKWAEL